MFAPATCPVCAAVTDPGRHWAEPVIPCASCGEMLRLRPGAAPVPRPRPATRDERAVAPAAPAEPPGDPLAFLDPSRHGPAREYLRKPAGRRGTGVIVAVAVGGFVVLLLGGVSVVFLLFGVPRWQEHDFPDGGYKVELPSKPVLINRESLRLDALEKADGAALLARREEYLVVYGPVFPQHLERGVDAMLDGLVESRWKGSPEFRLHRVRAIEVSGCPGREVAVTAPGLGSGVVRVVVAGDRVFTVVAAGSGADRDNERFRRFLDSFQVTDPQLLAAAAARREVDAVAARKKAEAEADARAKAAAAKAAAAKAEEEHRAFNAPAVEARAKARAEHTAELAKLRDAFRRPAARPAPDARGIPDLLLYFPFDAPRDHTPAGAGVVGISSSATRGPGARGPALYVPSRSLVYLESPSPELLAGLRGSITLAGWVKLRYQPTTLVGVRQEGYPLGSLSVGDGVIAFHPFGDRQEAVVSAPWQTDEEWHHVAVVRENRPADAAVTLYHDGKAVRTARATPADWSKTTRVLVGHTGAPAGLAASWDRPTGPPPYPDGLTSLPHDEPYAAVDEVCVFARALTAAEVRSLAGVTDGK